MRSSNHDSRSVGWIRKQLERRSKICWTGTWNTNVYLISNRRQTDRRHLTAFHTRLSLTKVVIHVISMALKKKYIYIISMTLHRYLWDIFHSYIQNSFGEGNGWRSRVERIILQIIVNNTHTHTNTHKHSPTHPLTHPPQWDGSMG